MQDLEEKLEISESLAYPDKSEQLAWEWIFFVRYLYYGLLFVIFIVNTADVHGK